MKKKFTSALDLKEEGRALKSLVAKLRYQAACTLLSVLLSATYVIGLSTFNFTSLNMNFCFILFFASLFRVILIISRLEAWRHVPSRG